MPPPAPVPPPPAAPPEEPWIAEARDASACVPGAMRARLSEACAHREEAADAPAASKWRAYEKKAIAAYCACGGLPESLGDVMVAHYEEGDLATASAILAETVDALVDLDDRDDGGRLKGAFVDRGVWAEVVVEPSGLAACQQRIRDKLAGRYEASCTSPGYVSALAVKPPETRFCANVVAMRCEVDARDAESLLRRGVHGRALAIFERLAFDERSPCPAHNWYAGGAYKAALGLGDLVLAREIEARDRARFQGADIIWPRR